jgi:hypothetical protein
MAAAFGARYRNVYGLPFETGYSAGDMLGFTPPAASRQPDTQTHAQQQVDHRPASGIRACRRAQVTTLELTLSATHSPRHALGIAWWGAIIGGASRDSRAASGSTHVHNVLAFTRMKNTLTRLLVETDVHHELRVVPDSLVQARRLQTRRPPCCLMELRVYAACVTPSCTSQLRAEKPFHGPQPLPSHSIS